ncbi:MAG: hypothetical protein ACOVRK_01465 [Chryseobacterium taeanense]|jgi:hypothetical protein
MKTKVYSSVLKKKFPDKKEIRKTAKFFAVSVLALLVFGFCTTSQKLNAG